MLDGTHLSGRDLRAERVRLGLTQADVAHRLGVSYQRVGSAERSISVAPGFAARYLAALGAVAVSPEARFDAALDALIEDRP
jgi:transcriptional regulator with XRE-family HTH domain